MGMGVEIGMAAQGLVHSKGGFPDQAGVGQGDMGVVGRLEGAVVDTALIGQKFDENLWVGGFYGIVQMAQPVWFPV